MSFTLYAETSPKPAEDWKNPNPIFKQQFDWLRLTSGEWLKGDIVSMYEDSLEFDSDKFGVKFFDCYKINICWTVHSRYRIQFT